MIKAELMTIQHWMKSILVNRGTLTEKMGYADQHYKLESDELVLGDEINGIETRMGIYSTGYLLRLFECMEADFPSLHTYLGDDLFIFFAKAYLMENPSRSHSLFDLSDGFADFLDRTRPRKPEMDERTHAKYDLPAELVRMERARLKVILAKGSEGNEPVEAGGIFSFFSGKNPLVQAHPCLQLLQQKMPLLAFYRKLLSTEIPEPPEPQTTYLAISRISYRLQMLELNAWQFQLLSLLKEENAAVSMHRLMHQLSERTAIAGELLIADVSLWIPFAIEMGFVVEMENQEVM